MMTMTRARGRVCRRAGDRDAIDAILVRTGVLVSTPSDVNECAAVVEQKIDDVDEELVYYLTEDKYSPAIASSFSILPLKPLDDKKKAALARDNITFREWREFRLEFKNWLAEWNDSVLGKAATGGWYDDCSQFAQRTNAWIDRFQKKKWDVRQVKLADVSEGPGGVFNKPSEDKPSFLDDIKSIVKWGVIAVVVVGGTLLVWPLAKRI